MSVAELLAEAIKQRDAVCKALRPNYPQPMDLMVNDGRFFSRLADCQVAAHREAERRGLAAHLVPMIDELADAHKALLDDAIESWNHSEDVDAGVAARRRPRMIRLPIFLRQASAIERLRPHAAKPSTPLAATGNDARDKWLYEQCKKPTIKLETIKNNLAKKTKWAYIDSIQGIRLAANRYAKRHGLPNIPSRQPGRPARKK
jgi:hypothetical protein